MPLWTRILAGYLLLIVLIGGISGYGYYNLMQLEEQSQQMVQDNMEQMHVANELKETINGQLTHLRGYVLFRDEAMRDDYRSSLSNLRILTRDLQENAVDAQEFQVFETLEHLTNAYVNESTTVTVLLDANQEDRALEHM
ncbi:CHASE3 domain sensor protein [Desulfitispora alkaliphila]|uniref:CHASE3 domain-containing protein n=1 Tax=Desulfitispora alkaliphila TaxID=622674 RepID=UPI003D24B4B7